MKKIISLLITAVIALSMCSCNSSSYITVTKELCGTFISIKVLDGENEKSACDLAFSRAAELEKVFSLTLKESEINKTNDSAYSKVVTISEDMANVVEMSLEISRLSGGAFDFTIGKLISLWGIGTENANVPSESDIKKCLGVSYKDIEFNAEKNEIKFLSDKVMLNFGAIAKGYIGDEMKKVIIENDVKSAIINLGGNVVTVGDKNGTDWKVAITDPFDTSNYTASLSVSDMSVVTSGSYEKTFTENGKTYHHILSPFDGFPADSGLVSVTVIGECSAECDAMATALFAMGVKDGKALAEKAGLEAIFISADGTITSTDNISEYSLEVQR